MDIQNMSGIQKSVSNSNSAETIRRQMSTIDRPTSEGIKENNLKQRKPWGLVGLIIILIVIILGLVFMLVKDRIVNYSSEWQAVFLSDGDVYFGKVIKINEQELILQNIYYLKERQNLQGGGASANVGDISLIKLGDEKHGPTDEMQINRDKVMYVESLKEDSRVVEAILKHENKKN